jgi:hypothetical protein
MSSDEDVASSMNLREFDFLHSETVKKPERNYNKI